MIPYPNGDMTIEAGRAPLCAPAIIYNNDLPSEGYHLRVTPDGIAIEAADERGLCWAKATLNALTEDNTVPCCDISDAPLYAWRGFMMDCARHFFPVDTVKAMIDLAARVKMNVFHWHLTDDQGWRVESKRFPQLHEQNKDYYTQEEIRDIVEFARLRGVEVVPEIDLPGHASAILAAFPELSCSGKQVRVTSAPGVRAIILCPGKEAVFDLLCPLLEEVAALFPSRYFHIGGDEAPKGEWRNCPHCQQRMEAEGLASPEDLQGWFTARLADHLRGLGKRCVCWNESLQASNLPKDIAIQYWAEVSEVGPARKFWEGGGDMIFSDQFNAYFDFSYGTVTLKKAYEYAPGLPGFQGRGLPALGLECCLWSEFVDTPGRLALQAFPRLYAMAEAAWTRPECKNYADFRRRLDLWLERNPGIGFTPPEQADLGRLTRFRRRLHFLRTQTSAPKPEDNAGVGGKLHWKYLLRWLKNYFT